MIRPADDVSMKSDGLAAMSLEEALGIKPEPPPQQQPMWVTEYYRGGRGNAQQFPIPLPSPEQMAEMQRMYEAQQAAKQAAAGGGNQAVANASPIDDRPVTPPPASPRRRTTLREPEMPSSDSTQVPYRASEPLPRTRSTRDTGSIPTSTSTGVNAPDNANPFADDTSGEVLP
jgi:hypothetical protein